MILCFYDEEGILAITAMSKVGKRILADSEIFWGRKRTKFRFVVTLARPWFSSSRSLRHVVGRVPFEFLHSPAILLKKEGR